MKYHILFAVFLLSTASCTNERSDDNHSQGVNKNVTPVSELDTAALNPKPVPEAPLDWMVYEGTIGMYESHVVAYLHYDESNAVSGVYYYSKHQKPLTLSGRYDPKSGTYSLTETYKGKTTGGMTFRNFNGNLKGSWRKSANTAEEQPMQLSFIEQTRILEPQPRFERYENTHQIAIFYNGNDDEEETVTDVLRVTVISPALRSFEYNVTGPNAHMGQASGLINMQNDSTGVFYGEDNCELTFRFRKKQVIVEEDNCSYYHGARAYLDNVLGRVK